MIQTPRAAWLCILLGAVLGLSSACSTASRINPLSGGDEKGQEDEEGRERISFLSFEQKLQVSEGLEGVGVALPGDYVNAGWPNEGGYANHTVQHPRIAENISRDWARNVGDGSSRRARIVSPPIVAAGKVFVMDGRGRVSAYSEEDGEKLWSVRLRSESRRDREGRGGGLAYGGGRLFATSGFGFVSAYDADNGEEVWRRDLQGPMHAPPTFFDGRVFAVSLDNELFAIDANDGAVLWTYQSLAESARILTASSPAVSGDLIVAPFASGEITALRVQNGRRIWTEALSRPGGTTPLSELNDIAGSPVIVDDTVYAVSHSGILVAIDQRSGQRLWAQPAGSIHMPWVVGNYLFVVTTEAEVACLSRLTGEVFWIRQLPRYRNEKKRKGRIAWAGPLLAGERLFVASSDGELLELSPQDGETLDSRKVGDDVFVPPVIANERLFVLSDNARLSAFR